MASIVKKTAKRLWVAPALKKVTIEEITAHSTASGNDGAGGHTLS